MKKVPNPVRDYIKLFSLFFLINSFLLLGTSLLYAYEPLPLDLPYQENGIFDQKYPKAYEYTFSLEPGQRLNISLLLPEGGISARLYEMGENNRVKERLTFPLENSIVAVSTERHFLLELRASKNNVPFTLTIEGDPILLFPVKGKTEEDIKSFIGDSRDEGIRSHEGIDIMAPEKTPVLAVRNGTISDTGVNPRGGKFVMIKDEEYPLHYYFAHLHSIKVKEGQKVKEGDLIGTVGDTGNAQNGDYHLHFGVYDQRFSFINPFYYITHDPLKPAMPLESIYTFPLPFSIWINLEKNKGHISVEEEGFLLEKDTPLLVIGNTSYGIKTILNENVLFLQWEDITDQVELNDDED